MHGDDYFEAAREREQRMKATLARIEANQLEKKDSAGRRDRVRKPVRTYRPPQR